MRIGDIGDKLAEDISEYLTEIVEANDLAYVDEELAKMIFNHYVYAVVKSKIEQAMFAFVVMIFALYVVLCDGLQLPKWVKFMTSYIMIFRMMPTGIWCIGEHALDVFSKKTVPEIFDENKSLWKAKNDDKKG